MTNPEVALSIPTGPFITNYHDLGSGDPVLLLHGSGPGVSAYVNWRLTFGSLSPYFRVLAPDLAGFGFTEVPEDQVYDREIRLQQIVDLLDALGIEKTHVVGNSFGGSMALALAIAHPSRVDKLVCMGAVGVPFEITAGLDAVWGYEPSEELMGRLMRETFAYDPALVTDELVHLRYLASIRPGVQEVRLHVSRATPALGRCHGPPRSRPPRDPPPHLDDPRPRRPSDPSRPPSPSTNGSQTAKCTSLGSAATGPRSSTPMSSGGLWWGFRGLTPPAGIPG
ncbi:MAG: alpha/beta hydrolase [Marmoricola sp.]